MESLNCKYNHNQVGLFLWGNIPDEIINCEMFVEEILLKTHVFITPGFIFGTKGDRYIRISLCASETKLLEAKKRIELYQSVNPQTF
jgi:aspartate/methionine/tyrosine aminotransferase